MDWWRYEAWVSDLIARSEKVYSCYEAGPTGFALHRRLTELGRTQNIVVAQPLDSQGKGSEQRQERYAAIGSAIR